MGRWRMVEMPEYVEDYPDMVEPAYIPFEVGGSDEFAFGCVTGQISGAGDFLLAGRRRDGRGPRQRNG